MTPSSFVAAAAPTLPCPACGGGVVGVGSLDHPPPLAGEGGSAGLQPPEEPK
jgi:hypothetical protein